MMPNLTQATCERVVACSLFLYHWSFDNNINTSIIPRINIQDDKGMAKAYQVRQVLKAIERLEMEKNAAK